MKAKKIIKIIIDTAMLILLPLLMAYSLIGETAHEWLGICPDVRSCRQRQSRRDAPRGEEEGRCRFVMGGRHRRVNLWSMRICNPRHGFLSHIEESVCFL